MSPPLLGRPKAAEHLTLNTYDLEQILAQHPLWDPLFHTIFGCEEHGEEEKVGIIQYPENVSDRFF